MQHILSKRMIVFLVLIGSFVFLPSLLMAKSDSTLAKATDTSMSQKPQKCDPALLISSTTLMQKIKDGQRIALIDVRTKEAFEKFHIPGSLHIPLHFVKTKTFLKTNPLVLIDEGYRYSELEPEVLYLREKGFQACILDGGLNAWKEKGGRIEGDYFAQVQLQQMPPRALYKEKGFDNWIIIDLSTKKAAEKTFPRAVHVPLVPSQSDANLKKGNSPGKTLRSAVNRTVRERNLPYYSVLIVNESGERYEDVKGIVKNAGIENVFYLEGGIKGYQEYVSRLALSWKSREERVKSVGGCKTCGKKVE